MTERQIAMEMLKTQTDEATARKMLDDYTDADLEKKMVGKWQAVQFMDELLRGEPPIKII